jgi:hypothetical protein
MAPIAVFGGCLVGEKHEMASATTKETRITIFSTLERELWIGLPPVLCM